MIRFFRSLYLTGKFFLVFGSVTALFALSFGFDLLYPFAQIVLVFAAALLLVDIAILYNPRLKLTASRHMHKLLSLGDDNLVEIRIESNYALPLRVVLIDELPFQLQVRDFSMKFEILPQEKKSVTYTIRPVLRGEYGFGSLNLFFRSRVGFVEKRKKLPLQAVIPVYPSVIQMKKFELKAFAKISTFQGIKRVRRLGHSYEFEQIKNYVRGDDFRSINWKATGRKADLMVNQYEDERSQPIYSVIDKSRAMHMPFNKLSLLDHAINTSLVISNIALLKHDKVGMISFAEKIYTQLKAEKSRNQLSRIMEALYNQTESDLEANYELFYAFLRQFVKSRGLLFLYTNFESTYAAERVMPILRKINNLHLLVVIFFKNTEILDYAEQEARTTEQIYFQTIAQKFVSEKSQVVQQMRQYGIQTILTRPEELSLNTVNKYLELKARGMI